MQARNHEVLRLAEKYSLNVIDLYSVSLTYAELLSEDGVHWQAEGYRYLANVILSNL